MPGGTYRDESHIQRSVINQLVFEINMQDNGTLTSYRASNTEAGMNGDLLVVLLLIGLPILAFLPTIIGLIRDVDDKGLVILLNVLGAITAGGGWVGAMILACRMPRRLRFPVRAVSPPVEQIPWPFGPHVPAGDDRHATR